MTITCKEAARMVSEGLDKDLPAQEQIRLRAHLAICRGCRALGDRFTFLRSAMRRIADRGDSG
jgi:predicted anti-sigma-YlaC factor YlaD